MRLREAGGRLRNAKVAVMRVSAKTVRHKILVAVMADGDTLFCPPGRFCGGRGARLDRLSQTGFGRRLRRRLFLYGATRCCSRCRLLLGHDVLSLDARD